MEAKKLCLLLLQEGLNGYFWGKHPVRMILLCVVDEYASVEVMLCEED